MMGAIIGDIVGSVYEWDNIKTKKFPFFRRDCFFTDDTVMTVATADAIMRGGRPDDFIDAYKAWGRRYPNAGYGGRFMGWLISDDREPYNSWGNGSAMRVSPCGWVKDGNKLAEISTSVTHNHPEGIKGAVAVTDAIMMCLFHRGANDKMFKTLVKEHIETAYGYNLSQTLDEIRPDYQFNESCRDTVPQAIVAFLESTDFEDAIRNAISLGGDSDTLAAITGSIAEAAYGIPDWIYEEAISFLDEPVKKIIKEWEDYINGK